MLAGSTPGIRVAVIADESAALVATLARAFGKIIDLGSSGSVDRLGLVVGSAIRLRRLVRLHGTPR